MTMENTYIKVAGHDVQVYNVEVGSIPSIRRGSMLAYPPEIYLLGAGPTGIQSIVSQLREHVCDLAKIGNDIVMTVRPIDSPFDSLNAIVRATPMVQDGLKSFYYSAVVSLSVVDGKGVVHSISGVEIIEAEHRKVMREYLFEIA